MTPKRINKMERHKLWDDRAGKLMERTFEKFGYGKKKEIKESLQDEERWTVEWFPATSDRRAIKKFHSGEEAMNFIKGENLLDAEDLAVYNPKGEEVDINPVQENSLLDQDDYNFLKKAVTGPVDKLMADGYTKEDLVDAFKACLDMDQSEIDSGGSSQEVYTMVDKLKMHVEKVDMDEDAREYISDELSMILDRMDANVGDMNEEEAIANPEVERAEDTARQAQIKALKAKLKAMQKTQGM
jgi:hypothetical protein